MIFMDRMILLVIALIALAGIYLGYQYFSIEDTKVGFGTEVNLATFNSILTNASDVYIVMDLRNVTDQEVRRNVMQCGVDLAGSMGLASKNKTFYSFDSDLGCIGVGQTYSVGYCISEMKNGIMLYIIEGNESQFYTDGMKVGIGKNYTSGSCSVR